MLSRYRKKNNNEVLRYENKKMNNQLTYKNKNKNKDFKIYGQDFKLQVLRKA